MSDYSQGKIYKIINKCKSEDETKIYVGSTCLTLEKRFKRHCQDSKTNFRKILYKKMRKYGLENFKIKLIENYPCNSKEELLEEEEFWREIFKSKYNMVKAFSGKYKNNDKYKVNKDKVSQEHKIIHKDRYKCVPCGFNSSRKCEYEDHLHSKKHINYYLNLDKEDFIFKKKYSCKLCNYETNRKYDYSYHLNTKKHKNFSNITIKISTLNLS